MVQFLALARFDRCDSTHSVVLIFGLHLLMLMLCASSCCQLLVDFEDGHADLIGFAVCDARQTHAILALPQVAALFLLVRVLTHHHVGGQRLRLFVGGLAQGRGCIFLIWQLLGTGGIRAAF